MRFKFLKPNRIIDPKNSALPGKDSSIEKNQVYDSDRRLKEIKESYLKLQLKTGFPPTAIL